MGLAKLMWRDVSDEVTIQKHKILFEGIEIGAVKGGMIGVLKEGFRVRLEREYDEYILWQA